MNNVGYSIASGQFGLEKMEDQVNKSTLGSFYKSVPTEVKSGKVNANSSYLNGQTIKRKEHQIYLNKLKDYS